MFNRRTPQRGKQKRHTVSAANAEHRRSPIHRPLVLAMHLAIVGGVAIGGADAYAQTAGAQSALAVRTYDIPAGPLTGALNRYAEESGALLTASGDMTRGRNSPGLKGRYSVQEGFAALLAGTGLEAFRQPDGSFGLRAVPVERGSAAAPVLPAVTVTAEAEKETATSRVRGYAARRSATATRSDVELRDTPASVTVVTQDAIRDIAPRSLDEIGDYIAGVDREAVQGNPYSISFYMRGFNTGGAASSYNGFRESGFETPQTAVNIERIEFLKGPASVLYGGAGSLSGLVNIVTKRPEAEPFRRMEVTAGSFDRLATSIDATGPIDEAGKLRYRLTAAVDKDGNFVPQVNQQSTFVSPVLSWDLAPGSNLEIELLAQDVDRPGREPYFIRHPDFLRIPINTQLGDPRNPLGAGGKITRRLARVDFTHLLDNGWKFRQGFYANNIHSDDTTIQGTSYDPATRLLSRRVRQVASYDRSRFSQTELSGTSSLAGLSHTWLVGVEIGRLTTGYGFIVAPYTPLDIFNPSYPGSAQGPLVVPFPGEDSGSDTRALYAQNLIDFGNGIKMLVGGRFDDLKSFSESRDPGVARSEQTDQAFSPRVGMVWQPRKDVSFYGSWSESFTPNRGRSRSGGTFDPQQGEQFEVGVKLDPTERLTLTAAVFQYLRQNVLTTDPSDTNFQIAVGEQRTRGLELEALGQLLPGWEVIASYNYLQAEITEDNRLPVGDRLVGVPRHSFGLFNKVSLARVGLTGWSVTAGISYAGKRESGLPNDPAGLLTAADVMLPSYTKVDAGLIYDTGEWRLQLTGSNLTDEKIYDGYISTFAPRAGRAYTLTYAVNF